MSRFHGSERPGMMIEVKVLPLERWQEVRDLRLEALRIDPAAFGSSVEDEENFPEAVWQERMKPMLVALSDNKPVGSVTYLFNDRVKTKHIARIVGFYVNPNYRGLGVGRKLMEQALDRIRENKDILKVQLMVNPKQEAAVALYKKLGFDVVGELKKELKVGEELYDMLVMEKYRIL
jgi:ribosomal protein S18 acetylase RimI-like enzyme